jgi:hypothetical protein
MIAFFLLPSFSCFQMKPTSNGGKKRVKQKEERARKREKEEDLWPSAIGAANKQRK